MTLTNKNFVCFPTMAWGRNWERQHEIIYFLAGITSGKVYIHQPFGMINYGLADLYRKVKGLRAELQIAPEEQANPLRENMIFLRTPFIPRHHNKWADAINTRLIQKATPVALQDAIVFATYVNSFTYQIFKKANFKILDLAARRQTLHELSADFKALEKEAVATADVVFADNIMTIKDYKSLNNNLVYLPQGVNLERFEGIPLSADLQHWRDGFAKVVGYSGSDIVMDYAFLNTLIAARPDYLFLFVGDMLRPESKDLLRYKNVLFTGRIDFQNLGAYYQLFDVGLIPYLLNDRTSGVFPTKLFEYLAAGVPVLTTALPDLSNFNKSFIVVADEKTAPEKVDMLMHKLPNPAELYTFVSENTWQARFDVLLEKIKPAL